jgi:hypothetical protein
MGHVEATLAVDQLASTQDASHNHPERSEGPVSMATRCFAAAQHDRTPLSL